MYDHDYSVDAVEKQKIIITVSWRYEEIEDHDSSVDAVGKWKILSAVLTLLENGDHDHSRLTLWENGRSWSQILTLW